MNDLQWQRSCSVSDGAMRIDQDGANEHAASVPILYIISYFVISYFVISYFAIS
jgi:hypothetical protein